MHQLADNLNDLWKLPQLESNGKIRVLQVPVGHHNHTEPMIPTSQTSALAQQMQQQT
jgi:hypothetical protein